jgi:nitrate reductase NapE component
MMIAIYLYYGSLSLALLGGLGFAVWCHIKIKNGEAMK